MLCVLTGRKLNRDNISLDHIVPLSKGGNNEGGLFLGCRLDFPDSIYDAEAFASKHTYTRLRLTFGLIVFSINVDIKYNYIKMLPI